MRGWLAVALGALIAATPARAGIAGDQACAAAGRSSGCLDATWPSSEYRPPRDNDRDGGHDCPECRAEALARLARVPELKAPTWSGSDLRKARLANVIRDDRETAGRLGPLLAARTAARPSPQPAAAVPPLPYSEADVTTSFPDFSDKVQNRYNKAILDAYRRVWRVPRYRKALGLVSPAEFKSIIAQESSLGLDRNAFRCARLQCARAVGLVQMTATNARQLGLRVDKKRDDRLDEAKLLPAALTLLAKGQTTFQRKFAGSSPGPSDTTLRKLTVLAYTAGTGSIDRALEEASLRLNKPLGRVKLTDVLDEEPGKPCILAAYVKKSRFESEVRPYLKKIRGRLSAADPLNEEE